MRTFLRPELLSRTVWGTLLYVGGAIAGRAVDAQAPQPRGGTPVVLDTMIQPGHRDYTRYTTPGMCLAAVKLVRDNDRRATMDTTRAHSLTPDHEPLPDSAVATARACGGRFTAAGVPVSELYNLSELALAAGDDARSRAAFERWRTTVVAPDSVSQAWVLFDRFGMLARARPARFAAIDTVAAQLDQLGKTAAYQRAVIESWRLLPASRAFDVAGIGRGVSAVLRVLPDMTPRDQDMWLGRNGGGLFGGYVYVQYWQGIGIGDAWLDLNKAVAARTPMQLSGLKAAVRARAGVTWFPAEQNPISRAYQLLTTPFQVPSLPAKYWFGNQGEHRWPVPGRVSLLLDADWSSETPDESRLNLFAILRRAHAKYGDALNITLMYRTKGYFRDSPPLDPAAESEAARKYYLEYLKLPVNLAVVEVPMSQLPDGRRLLGRAAYDTLAGYSAPGIVFGTLLVDGHGQGLFRGFGWFGNQGELEAYIDRALGRLPRVTGQDLIR